MKKFFSSKKRNAILTAVSFGICFANFSITTAETPSFFDWRLNNPTDSTSGADSLSIVSPVEDQGDYGTCWTFGTFASYESSWLKQLKAAQAAGYNVTPTRTIFSKLYLAWTSQMPAVDNSDDTSIRSLLMPGADIYDYGHTVYDQGGDVSKATSALIKDGAIDENSVTLAQTDEQKSYAADAMNTSANWDRINNFARMYVAYQEYKDLDISEAEMGKLVTERAKTLTDEEIAQTAQDAFNAAIPDAVLETVTPKGSLHDTYLKNNLRIQKT